MDPGPRRKKVPFRGTDATSLLVNITHAKPASATSKPPPRRRAAHVRMRRVLPLSRSGLRFVLDSPFAAVARTGIASPADLERIVEVEVPGGSDDKCPICLDDHMIAPRISVCCSQCMCLPCLLRLQQHGLMGSCPVCQHQGLQVLPARLRTDAAHVARVGETTTWELVVHSRSNPYFVLPVTAPQWRALLAQGRDVLLSAADGDSRYCRFVFADDPLALAVDEGVRISEHIALVEVTRETGELEQLPFWRLALEANILRQRECHSRAAAQHEDARIGDVLDDEGDLLFYYRCPTAVHLYADPFAMRLLMHHHKCSSPAQLPASIAMRVDCLTANKKFAFVSHLVDSGTEWTIAECRVPHLGPETRRAFADEFKKRAESLKRLQRKKAAEDRLHNERARAEEAKLRASHPIFTPMEPHDFGPPMLPVASSADAQQPPPRFLSYAAIASADGASYGPSSTAAGATETVVASSSPGKMSWAQSVKATAPPPPIQEPVPAVERTKRGKTYVVLTPNAGGGRRLP